MGLSARLGPVLLGAGLAAGMLRAQEAPVARPLASPEPVILVKNGYVVVSLPQEGVSVLARPKDLPEIPDKGWASWAQRGDLIWAGEMTDSKGRVYNVRILPGYPVPARNAAEAWVAAGGNLHEYVEAQTWKDLGRHMKTSFRWGWKDAFWEFGLEGTGKAWKEHFSDAAKRVKRRTFGWPLAYPWAFLVSTFESAFRIVGGVGGGLGGTVTAAAILPAVESTWPLVKASYHAGVEGVIFPVTAWTWQTVAAPPAALLAAAPSPDRADGLWMRVEVAKAKTPAGPTLPPPEPVLAALSSYAQELALLDRDSAPQLQALAVARKQALAEVEARFEAQRRQVLLERERRLQAWLEVPENRQAVLQLAMATGTVQELRKASTHLINRLVAGGMAEFEAKEVVERLLRHPLVQGSRPQPLSEKVEPGRSLLKAAEPVVGLPLAPPPKTP